MALIALLAACTPAPLTLDARPVPGGIEVRASRPVERVEARDSDGAAVQVRRLDPPVDTVFLAVEPRPGEQLAIVARAGPVEQGTRVRGVASSLSVEARTGDRPAPVADGDVVRLPPGAASLTLAISSDRAGEAAIRWSAGEARAQLAPGERWLGTLTVSPPEPIEVAADGERVGFTVVGEPIPQGAIRVSDLSFPTDAAGDPERARTPDRVDLPSRPWRAALAAAGVGWRPRADLAPWAWQEVTLASSLDSPVDAVIRATVIGPTGEAEPAFDARLREGRRPELLAVVRVPAGGKARVALPLYVDGDAAPDRALLARKIEVLPLGGGSPLAVGFAPLAIARSGTTLWLAAAASAGAALAGWALLLARWRAWMAASTPGELVAIALLGTLAHAVGVAVQLAAFGVAMVLGPFAPFLTGIADDAVRACVYATLLALYPRPGVVALATVVGSVVRAVVLGAVHPIDLVFIGANVACLEGGAALAGLTRPGWADAGRAARWARLSLGFSTGNAAVTAIGIVVGAVVYRLFYAPGYVAAVVLLPGAAYASLGCAAAVGFSGSLRRVAP